MALCLWRWFWRGDVPDQAEREVADIVPRDVLLRWLGEFGPDPVREVMADHIGYVKLACQLGIITEFPKDDGLQPA